MKNNSDNYWHPRRLFVILSRHALRRSSGQVPDRYFSIQASLGISKKINVLFSLLILSSFSSFLKAAPPEPIEDVPFTLEQLEEDLGWKCCEMILFPDLSDGQILGVSVGDRPMGASGVVQDVLQVGDVRIYRNEGHGGAGFTIGYGTAQSVVNRADIENQRVTQKKLPDDSVLERTEKLDRNTPIAVVGGGVVGLETAAILWAKGFRNITVFAEELGRATTSFKAGAYLALVSIEGLDDTVRHEEYTRAQELTWIYYQRLARSSGNSDVVKYLPVFSFDGAESGLEALPDSVAGNSIDLSSLPFAGLRENAGFARETFAIDPQRYMFRLWQRLKDHGVQFSVGTTFQEVNDLTNLTSSSGEPIKLVFSCLGNGACEVYKDERIERVRGWLVHVKGKLPYMVYFKDTEGNSVYAFPRKVDGDDAYFVVGGTFTKADKEIPEVGMKKLIPWDKAPSEAREVLFRARKLLLGQDSLVSDARKKPIGQPSLEGSLVRKKPELLETKESGVGRLFRLIGRLRPFGGKR